MKTPTNLFKQSILQKKPQIGLWISLASAYSAEICACTGFDWLLIDGEHAPNTIPNILSQLQAIASIPGNQALARVPVGDTAIIKQYLDIGVQTILVPMVDTAGQAQAIVQAARYPQNDGLGGVRGMAGARASRWGKFPNYAQEANEQVCILVQVETQTGLDNLEEIACTPGVDGILIGPNDLSASLGHVGDANHPRVQTAIEDAIKRILKVGKAPGILTINEEQAKHYLSLGVVFICVGVDTSLLMRNGTALAEKFKNLKKIWP